MPGSMETLNDWLARAEQLHPKNIELGLDRAKEMAARMGLRFDCPVITVAGTNGKGSTCAMLESILRHAGYRTAVALFNTLGSARSDFSETSWIAELKLSKLNGAITDVTGVDDCTITVPAFNIVPVDDYGETVPFLVPGVIEVLKP